MAAIAGNKWLQFLLYISATKERQLFSSSQMEINDSKLDLMTVHNYNSIQAYMKTLHYLARSDTG